MKNKLLINLVIISTIMIVKAIKLINTIDYEANTLLKIVEGEYETNDIPKLSAKEIKKYLFVNDVFIIDTREMSVSRDGYLPRSIILPLTLSYSTWLKALVDEDKKIILLTEKDEQDKSISQTKAIGNWEIIGYIWIEDMIKDGCFNIQKVVYNSNTYSEIDKLVKENKYIIDIREEDEFRSTGVIKEAHLSPLSSLKKNYSKIPKDKEIYVYCKSGMRAIVGSTFVKKMGYENDFIIMEGGMNKAIQEGYPLVPYP